MHDRDDTVLRLPADHVGQTRHEDRDRDAIAFDTAQRVTDLGKIETRVDDLEEAAAKVP